MPSTILERRDRVQTLTKSNRILVTGGAGYIGTTLVPMLLSSGYKVRVLDTLLYGGQGLLSCYGDIEFISGTITNDNTVTRAVQEVDTVIHLAAYVGEPLCAQKGIMARMVNAHATRTLARRAQQSGVKLFVLASTCSNYGVSQGELANEDAELMPLGLYAITKITAERVVCETEYDGFKTVILRFATAYGLSPRMRLDVLINQFARDAERNKKLTIYAPDAWRPFAHVKDIARFILHIMHPAIAIEHSVYNVGGHNWRKRDVAIALLEMVKGLKVEYNEKTKDKRDYKVSFDRALSIGFTPQYAPHDGLLEVVRATKDNLLDYPMRYKNV